VRAFISLKTGDLFKRPRPGRAPAETDTAESIEALEAALKGTAGSLRFVKDDARHLTLRFFGDLDQARQGEVARTVSEVAGSQKPFAIAPQGVGFFPNAVRPKVVWVGVEDLDGRIQPLHRALDEALKKVGLEGSGEAFVPHITVARVTRAPPGPALADAVDPFVNARFGGGEAEGLEFIESTLQKGGPVYRRIALGKFAPRKG
jgi:2'-5' RNA ligase